MPQNGLEMLEMSRDFYQKAKFPRKTGAIVRVLHNIATDERDALPEVRIERFADLLEASQVESRPYPARGRDAGTVRSQLVANYFPHLMANAAMNQIGE